MQEVTADKLQIAYEGPAIQGGRMAMLALGSSLRGQALLIQRVKDILYADRVNIRVEIDHEFESSSLIVPVHIFTDAITIAEHILSGEAATALANLIAILGFGGGGAITIYKLFKRLKGRRIENPEDVPEDLRIDISVELLIRLYNDPKSKRNFARHWTRCTTMELMSFKLGGGGW